MSCRPDLPQDQVNSYRAAADGLLTSYARVHEKMLAWYQEKLPRPEDMKPEAYKRNLAARAFDVARYCLFFGIPTGVGQVVSIRTLEKQVRRLKASPYQELRELGDEIGRSVARPADCGWTAADANEPVAPTLTKFVDAEEHPVRSKADLTVWARQNLATSTGLQVEDVDLMRPSDTMADAVRMSIVASWEITGGFHQSDNVPRLVFELVANLSGKSSGPAVELNCFFPVAVFI